jgi:hypothetical protein
MSSQLSGHAISEREEEIRSHLSIFHFVDFDRREVANQKVGHLMTDQNPAYRLIAAKYAGHSYVNHSDEEFARGEVHNNTAESLTPNLSGHTLPNIRILDIRSHAVYTDLSKII